MKKLLSLILLIALWTFPANATTSTINPNVPATNAPLTSSMFRGQFQAAYNDINNLWAYVQSGTSIGYGSVSGVLDPRNGGLGFGVPCSAGQVIGSDGTNYICSTVTGTGTVTTTGSIVTGKLAKFSGTTAITNAVAGTDYQIPITLTTTGTSGAATFNTSTGALNIPTYAGGGSGTVTSFAFTSANGLGGSVSTATTTPTLTLNTTVTGLVKGNGTTFSAASSGTDYAPATSGSSLLYGNGSGGFSAATLANGVTFSGGVLGLGAITPTTVNGVVLGTSGSSTLFLTSAGTYAAPLTLTTTGSAGAATFSAGVLNIPQYSGGGSSVAGVSGDIQFNSGGTLVGAHYGSGLSFTSSTSVLNTVNNGTVTALSFVSANGFGGNFATNTTTPALTLNTTITGLLKGNATAMSAATAGTDYSAGTSALTTGILKSTTTTGALTIAVAGDFPTLNQNTTGSAATLTTPRAINGTNFDGSAAITVTAAAGTLTGTTLASGVTASSLTSFGSSIALGTPASGVLTNATGLPISTGVSGLGTGVATFLATPSSANAAAAVTDETGTGLLVFNSGGTFIAPILGTPASATLTNATGLPVSTGISGLGTGVAAFLATPSSANFFTAITNETGSGLVVGNNAPTFIAPVLGAATATSINGLAITSSTGTLTLTNAKTLSATNTLTLSGTDGTTLNFGSGGTLVASAFIDTTNASNITTGTLAIAQHPANLVISNFGVTVDGGGSVPATGSKGYITATYNATITNWYMAADQSCSAVIDVKRSGTSIVGGGNLPTLSTAQFSSAAVSSWTSTTVTAGDVLEFNLNSASTCTRVNLVVKSNRT